MHLDFLDQINILRDYRENFFCNEDLGSQCWLPVDGVRRFIVAKATLEIYKRPWLSQ